MKESKSKCRRKRHEGEYDLHDERRAGHYKEFSDRRVVEERRVVEGKHSHHAEYTERRVVEERRVIEDRRVSEKHRSRPHPLDPLDDGRYYRSPIEDRHRAERHRHASDDRRHNRVVSEDRRGRHENGGGLTEDKDRASRLNGHHHHHHHRKHKHREDPSVEHSHKKKKSCRRKREKKKIEKAAKSDHKEPQKERSRSQSLSPSPSSSSSSSPSPPPPPQQPQPPLEPKPPKEVVRDVAPATHLNLPPPPAPAVEPPRPSYWDDDENKPARYRTNWGKKDGEDGGNGEEGEVAKEKKPVENIAKPDFGLSGKLVEETNTYKGVVIKYSQPAEARMPKRRWRLYPFKGDQALPTLYIHRQSAYLIGRERKIVDIPVDHPSISKQHAVLQYRLVPYTRDDGTKGQRIRPYIIDLNSANGTFVNNQKIDPSKYVELLERDVVKFAFSSREYVLLHEHSSEGAQDDEAV